MKVPWNEVTAVFGGTFDPPHRGHREAVEGLFKNPGIKQVLILPAGNPPLKGQVLLASHRLEMTKLNFAGIPEVEIDDREIQKKKEKPSYTYETLLELKQEISKLAFVIGTDQLVSLDRWYRFPEILDLCHWIILCRMPDGETKGLEILREWETSGLMERVGDRLWKRPRTPHFLLLTSTPAGDVSSTEIRESLVLKGEFPENSLLPSVEEYLMQNVINGTKGK